MNWKKKYKINFRKSRIIDNNIMDDLLSLYCYGAVSTVRVSIIELIIIKHEIIKGYKVEVNIVSDSEKSYLTPERLILSTVDEFMVWVRRHFEDIEEEVLTEKYV